MRVFLYLLSAVSIVLIYQNCGGGGSTFDAVPPTAQVVENCDLEDTDIQVISTVGKTVTMELSSPNIVRSEWSSPGQFSSQSVDGRRFSYTFSAPATVNTYNIFASAYNEKCISPKYEAQKSIEVANSGGTTCSQTSLPSLTADPQSIAQVGTNVTVRFSNASLFENISWTKNGISLAENGNSSIVVSSTTPTSFRIGVSARQKDCGADRTGTLNIEFTQAPPAQTPRLTSFDAQTRTSSATLRGSGLDSVYVVNRGSDVKLSFVAENTTQSSLVGLTSTSCGSNCHTLQTGNTLTSCSFSLRELELTGSAGGVRIPFYVYCGQGQSTCSIGRFANIGASEHCTSMSATPNPCTIEPATGRCTTIIRAQGLSSAINYRLHTLDAGGNPSPAPGVSCFVGSTSYESPASGVGSFDWITATPSRFRLYHAPSGTACADTSLFRATDREVQVSGQTTSATTSTSTTMSTTSTTLPTSQYLRTAASYSNPCLAPTPTGFCSSYRHALVNLPVAFRRSYYIFIDGPSGFNTTANHCQTGNSSWTSPEIITWIPVTGPTYFKLYQGPNNCAAITVDPRNNSNFSLMGTMGVIGQCYPGSTVVNGVCTSTSGGGGTFACPAGPIGFCNVPGAQLGQQVQGTCAPRTGGCSYVCTTQDNGSAGWTYVSYNCSL